MACRGSNVGSATTAPQHESGGAAGRSPPLLAQAPLMEICETIALWFCNMSKVVLKNSRISRKQKQDIDLGEAGEYVFPLLIAHTTCWLWVFFITFLLLPSGVYSAEASEQGTCRYDLTSIATLSCVLPNGAWREPSLTCCNALLHAVDHAPSSDESGACCLCRYVKEKRGPPEVVTPYVLCGGKDRYIVTEWASFPFESCAVECSKRKNPSPGMDISAHEDGSMERVENTGKDIFKFLWIIVSVFVVIGLICFWYFWRFKPITIEREQGHTRAGRRRSSGSSRSEAQHRRRGF